MEKQEKLFVAIYNALHKCEKDGVTIVEIQSLPDIQSHLPEDMDKSFMENWTEVTINILARGRERNEDGDYIEDNYRINLAKFALIYNPNDKNFTAKLKGILSIRQQCI